MSARSLPYHDIKQCAEPDCICHTRVVQAGKKVITGNVLMRRANEEMRLCLLCYFAYRLGYETAGWAFVEQFKVEQA